MNKRLIDDFLNSDDTLRVYEGKELLFSSKKERLAGLLDYLDMMADKHRKVLILDRVIGNAAALLVVKACGGEVYSPLGSDAAIETLHQYGIKHRLDKVVPCIQQDNRPEICPMEALSMGKTPEEFYAALKARIGR